MSPRAIVWAADHADREVWVGGPTVTAIVGNALVPRLADAYLARTGFDAQQTDGAPPPDRRDNLWAPVDDATDHGAHGDFDARAHPRSYEFWAPTHRHVTRSPLAAMTPSPSSSCCSTIVSGAASATASKSRPPRPATRSSADRRASATRALCCVSARAMPNAHARRPSSSSVNAAAPTTANIARPTSRSARLTRAASSTTLPASMSNNRYATRAVARTTPRRASRADGIPRSLWRAWPSPPRPSSSYRGRS